MYVICDQCHQNHAPDEVEFVNVEEDIYGRDLITFVCPVTQQQTDSLVYN